ncbi:MAG: PP2C family protein-serine/threonine phosphatase, partial [Clostridia bacterium]|nr:PP2C family protein-serine/threonine phosphatase [Clostridia bacterium]
KDVKTILTEGGDETPEYQKMYDLFNQLKKDGDITFLSLVVPDEDSVCFYIDAMVEEMGDDPANQLPYGSDILYVDAANPDDPADMEKYITIWERYRDNKGIDTPLVTDNDYGYNYTGVSVILDENGNAIAEIQYILDMSEVRAYLNSFLINMLLISFAIIGITIILYIFFVRKMVTKPVGKLTAFTQEITKTGMFENQHIDIKTGDEIESLSQSFNFMLAELENYIANLSKVTAEKERIGAELDIAKHIQASMLPCIFPAFPERKEFDIYATMEPAKEVGGDFYDFFMVDDTHLAIVMADVSGKGVPAALFMVIGKTLIKDHTTPGRDLGKVFTEVNQLLCESNSEELFITAFEGVLDLVTGEFVYVNAGHEMPFICKAGGDFEPYKIRAGFVLAGMEGMKYRAGSTRLEPGDKIFQYTDGVTEATNLKNELYGMNRLGAILNKVKGGTPNDILPAIKKDIDEFVGDADQFDDITMLCLEYKARMENNEEDAQ